MTEATKRHVLRVNYDYLMMCLEFGYRDLYYYTLCNLYED